MKKLLYLFVFTFIAISCQIEDDNAPSPDDSFIKYLGEFGDQEAKDIEPIYAADNVTIEGLVIFGTQRLEGNNTRDYSILRTDLSGNIVDSITYNPQVLEPVDWAEEDPSTLDLMMEGDETAGQIEVLPNGGYLIVGTTSFVDNILDVDIRYITGAILDADLNVTNSFHAFADGITVDSQLDLLGNDIISLSGDTDVNGVPNILVVGSIETNPPASDFDYYYSKLSGTDASLLYSRTSGIPGQENNDVLVRAFETETQTLALFGYTEKVGRGQGEGTNVEYFEINYNGVIGGGAGVWGVPDVLDENNNVREFDDVLTAVIEKPGGYLAVGTSTVDVDNYMFFMDIDRSGNSLRRDTIGSDLLQNGRPLETEGLAVTATAANDFAILGNYTNYRVTTTGGDEARGQEGMFIRVNQGGEKVGFESNFGLSDGNDSIVDAITLPDGKIMVLATIDFGGGIRLISLIKLFDTGELDR